MAEKEYKTSEALRRAIAKYEEKIERINVRLPLGTRKRIKKLGYKSANSFFVKAILERLEREEGYKK